MTQQDGIVRKWWVQRIGHYVGAKGNYIAPNGFEEPCLSNEMMCAEHNRLVSLVQAQSEALERAAEAFQSIHNSTLPGGRTLDDFARDMRLSCDISRAALSAIRAQLGEKEE